MKKRIAFITILLLLGGILGCTNTGSTPPELMEPVGVKLDTAVVTQSEIFMTKVYKGEVVPCVEELSFAMDGYLGECFVKLGDIVEQDQILITLDVEQLQKQIDTLEAEIAHAGKMGAYSDRLAELDIEIAEAQLEVLRQTGASVDACKDKALEIEQRKLNLAQDRELRGFESRQKEAALEKLKKQAENAVIKAPNNGRIVYVSPAKEGSAVRANATVIGIADEDRLCVSTEYITPKKIEDSDRVYARILDTDVPLRYIPMDNAEYVSKVSAGEEIKSEFAMEATSQRFHCGQFAAVMLLDTYKEDVLTIPVNALFRDEKGRYVYKIQEGERIRCNITVGIINDVKAEITEGLQEGDVVYVQE